MDNEDVEVNKYALYPLLMVIAVLGFVAFVLPVFCENYKAWMIAP